jgi:phosphomannomutase
MKKYAPQIFRAYDVRGVYGSELTDDAAYGVGRAYGTFLGEGKSACVGRDVRASGSALCRALINGLLDTGVDVVDVGIVPTPILHFAVLHCHLDGGVMVTASHNPPEWNGFKFSGAGASRLCEEENLKEVAALFADRRFSTPKHHGSLSRAHVIDEYAGHVAGKVKLQRKLKVVLDLGNGAWCGIAGRIFTRAGFGVSEINGDPNGDFPGRGPDPTDQVLVSLKSEVVSRGADFGAAFDGDGDRVSFIDDLGRYVGADGLGVGSVILPIFAAHYLKMHPGGKVVLDIATSSKVEEIVRSLGGIPVLSRVGYPNILRSIMKESAIFGGEYSSHFFLPENEHQDDGCFAALKLAAILSEQNLRLSELTDTVPKLPNVPETDIPCPDEIKFSVVDSLNQRFLDARLHTSLIDGVKAIAPDGWVLVRPSNTQPLIRICAEGTTRAAAERLFTLAKSSILDAINEKNA